MVNEELVFKTTLTDEEISERWNLIDWNSLWKQSMDEFRTYLEQNHELHQKQAVTADYNDVGYTSYSDPRLQPPEGEEYREIDAYDDEVEIEFDTEITVEPGGNWDFNNTDYASWMEGMNVVGDNIYGNQEDVILDDVDGVADKIFDLTSMNIPIVPGRYRISGIADLFYHVSGVEYDDEGTAYADKADIDYEYKKSSVRNLQVEKLD